MLAALDREARSIATATVGALTTAALCLRRAGDSYTYDESVTVELFIDQDSFVDTFTTQRVFNNHPLLSAVNWIVWHLGGQTEAWQRALPILATCTCVVLVSVWTARRFGSTASLCATTLVATNPMIVDLGSQARGYAFVALAATASTYLLDPWLRGGRLRTAPYVAIVVLGMLSHLYLAIVVLAHGAGALWARRDNFATWFRAVLLTALLTVIGHFGVLGTMAASADARSRRFVESFPSDVVSVTSDRWWLALALGACGVAAIVSSRRYELRAMAATGVVAVTTMWIFVQPYDLYPRFLIWLVPLIATAIAALVRRHPAALGIGVMCALVWVPLTINPQDDVTSVRQQAAAYEQLSTVSKACTYGFLYEALGAYLQEPVRRAELEPACETVLFRATDADRISDPYVVVGHSSTAPDLCIAAQPRVRVERLDVDPRPCGSTRQDRLDG